MLKAVKNVEQLAEAIKGMDPTDQEAIDKKVPDPPTAPPRACPCWLLCDPCSAFAAARLRRALLLVGGCVV